MAHAALIHFPDHMTQKECDDILARMFKAGYCKGVTPDFRIRTFGRIRSKEEVVAPKANAFNPDHGSPCWYIP